MGFLKLSGCLCTITCGTMLGLLYASRARARAKELRKIMMTIKQLEGLLRYHKAPIFELMVGLERRADVYMRELFYHVRKRIGVHDGSSFGTIWAQETACVFAASCLKQEELELISSMGDILCSADHQTQLAMLGSVEEQLDRLCVQIEADNQSRLRLYPMSGILCGILVTILIL